MKILKIDFGSVENLVGKGENAGAQHFLLFLKCFKSSLFQGHYKWGLCGKELTVLQQNEQHRLKIQTKQFSVVSMIVR